LFAGEEAGNRGKILRRKEVKREQGRGNRCFDRGHHDTIR
jgi:hypothetical protein